MKLNISVIHLSIDHFPHHKLKSDYWTDFKTVFWSNYKEAKRKVVGTYIIFMYSFYSTKILTIYSDRELRDKKNILLEPFMKIERRRVIGIISLI